MYKMLFELLSRDDWLQTGSF